MARIADRRKHRPHTNLFIEQLESRQLFSVVTLTADTTKVLTLTTGETLNGNGHKVGGLTGYDVSSVSVNNLKVTASRGASDGIDIYSDESGLTGITLSNITASGFSSGYGVVIGTWGAGTFSNVSLSNITAYNNGEAGISTYGAVGSITNFSLTSSTAYNNAGLSGNNGPSGSGIMLAGLNGGLVEHCTAYGNGGNNNASSGPVGIWAYDSNAVTITYCNSYSNKTRNSDGGGFDLDGGVTNSVVSYCTSSNNAGYGYAAFTYSGSNANTGNAFIGNSSTSDKEGFLFWSAGPVISNLTFTGNTISKPKSGYAIIGYTGADYVSIVLSPNTSSAKTLLETA